MIQTDENVNPRVADNAISDVGITVISYTEERGSFIDYSHPVGLDGMKWTSKPPQKLPPATNIIRIFDGTTWLLVLVSMTAVREVFHIYINLKEVSPSKIDRVHLLSNSRRAFPAQASANTG